MGNKQNVSFQKNMLLKKYVLFVCGGEDCVSASVSVCVSVCVCVCVCVCKSLVVPRQFPFLFLFYLMEREIGFSLARIPVLTKETSVFARRHNTCPRSFPLLPPHHPPVQKSEPVLNLSVNAANSRQTDGRP